ncbi:MAG: 50S ribosomal protein L31 [Deltaproteobacteria bacterium]|jgi:large subunit ribosomal protein L31|nr:50S ribosomal protein L31 [Deltaproteobacteria bacterium]
MKEGIHPNYIDCEVRCNCGNSFKTRSVLPEIKITICNVCHPFYSGTQRLVDTQGRIDRFKRRYANSAAVAKK